jgi:hypothetical protein
MTHDEARVEVVARRLCELRDIDPDAMVPHGAEPDANGIMTLGILYSPAWQRMALEVRRRMEMDAALAGQE